MKLWRSALKALDGWTTWGRSGLAEEAEAYLQGDLLERMHAWGAGGQAPAWMWLNAVAHGDRDLVEKIAAPCPSRTVPGSWRQARALLARELLDRSAGDDQTLRRLQQRALIPLEL